MYIAHVTVQLWAAHNNNKTTHNENLKNLKPSTSVNFPKELQRINYRLLLHSTPVPERKSAFYDFPEGKNVRACQIAKGKLFCKVGTTTEVTYFLGPLDGSI